MWASVRLRLSGRGKRLLLDHLRTGLFGNIMKYGSGVMDEGIGEKRPKDRGLLGC